MHLEALPLGPNVAAFVGHSNLRMHVMIPTFGDPRPSHSRGTEDHVYASRKGLDAGYLGLSVQTLPWDKLDETDAPSPFLLLCHVVRIPHIHQNLDAIERIFQGVPNLVKKWNVALFLWESAGLFRRPLKTTIISIMDLIANQTSIGRFPFSPDFLIACVRIFLPSPSQSI